MNKKTQMSLDKAHFADSGRPAKKVLRVETHQEQQQPFDWWDKFILNMAGTNWVKAA